MALATCADCAEPVSTSARACPACGAPTESRTAAEAKRRRYVTAAVVVVMVLVAVLLANGLSYVLAAD